MKPRHRAAPCRIRCRTNRVRATTAHPTRSRGNMRTTSAAVVTAAALLALAARSSSDGSKPAPIATTSTPATAPALSHAEIVKCTTAVAALPPGPNGIAQAAQTLSSLRLDSTRRGSACRLR